MPRWLVAFEDGDGRNKQLLGGKGANLCEMTQIGLPVPPGFTITTEACNAWLADRRFPEGLAQEVRAAISALERKTGRGFGDPTNPLLVSVRSGSAMSMPGMMDTILNLGLNDATRQGLARASDDERFAWDSYRRFVQLFGKIALGVPDERFDHAMTAIKRRVGVSADLDLTSAQLAELTGTFLALVQEHTGAPFPQDPHEQLDLAVAAVFASWMGRRAVDYRRQFRITPQMANGTAVNVCTMVFGNLGPDSATGVGFTRNPGTGEASMYGEYLVNAQGEDVVAGIRTPKPIAELALEMPRLHAELVALRDRLEAHYHEVQDFEFTIERGHLYALQTRNAKMNAAAMVKTSVDFTREGLLTRDAALARVHPSLLEQLMVPTLPPHLDARPIATGLPASPGAASGQVVFDADTAVLLAAQGKALLLVREETKPEDIHGFFAARGVLTSRGGKTSHAAVVARGMGKPCVSGCDQIVIDTAARVARVGEHVLHEGDTLTIDGTTGNVYVGRIETVAPDFSDDLQTLLGWADDVAALAVFANADTPADAARARRFGATGIGLCRTERMFNAVDRLPIVQDMILADTPAERAAALERLRPIQRADFEGIFEAMAGLPVTIRLLDPPIHEFLPTAAQLESDIDHLLRLGRTLTGMDELPDTLRLLDPDLHKEHVHALERLSQALHAWQGAERDDALLHRKEALLRKVRQLSEVNAMLGHRGVRLGLTHPEIYAMQIRAVMEAAAACRARGVDVHAEIMVPQVADALELLRVKAVVDALRPQVEGELGGSAEVRFGSMIEVVRAALLADELARHAEFFSFGTNDLTQAAFSFSREDAENKFLPFYVEQGLLPANPFEALDTAGVGKLITMTVALGRATRPDLKVGICGEQGGHPESIHFCHAAGLDYVSCSPPRVPVARLAAAQAQLAAPR